MSKASSAEEINQLLIVLALEEPLSIENAKDDETDEKREEGKEEQASHLTASRGDTREAEEPSEKRNYEKNKCYSQHLNALCPRDRPSRGCVGLYV